MLRSSQLKLAGAGKSTTRAPRLSHARLARVNAGSHLFVYRHVGRATGKRDRHPRSGREPGRAVSGNSPIAAAGAVTGVGSGPPAAIPASSAAQSATVRAIGPGWSSEGASGMMPSIGIRPWLGLIALVPQQADGIRSDPQVSLPSAPGTIRAASAAALPPLEPPDHPLQLPGIADLVGGAPGGELVGVGMPKQHRALAAQARPGGGVVSGHVALQHATGGGERQAGDAVEVLQGEGNSAQQGRPRPLAREALVGGPGLLARDVGIEADPGIHGIGRAVVCRRPAVALGDPAQAGLGQLGRGQPTVME